MRLIVKSSLRVSTRMWRRNETEIDRDRRLGIVR
jgi:hypothetical protein